MIGHKIKIITDRIAEKCITIGKNEEDIKLVAVSKQIHHDAIIEARKYGITNFGENRVQELKQKTEICPLDINWHFIGHLQTNKVKSVVQFAEIIHSVDTMKLAKEINKRAGNIEKKQKILLEINTSGEKSKFGIKVDEEILGLANYCRNAQNLNLLGLMTMAPYTADDVIVRNSFKSLNDIFIKLNEEGFGLSELSMGMTNDYEIAIEEGATILRIGTALFGSR